MDRLSTETSRRFADKVVMVMGAGSTPAAGWGNGRATAVAFAREGAEVVAVDLHQDRADETRALIEKEGGRCLALSADVTRRDQIVAAAERALEAYGRIDVLHNNVGVAGGDSGTVERTTEDAWDKEMAVSAKSVFLCMQAVVPAMVRQGRGVITNVSSTLATRFIERPSLTYTAAKAAVEAMTRSVSISHGPLGIRANCIRVGFMDTPVNRAGWTNRLASQEALDAALAAAGSVVPLGYMGDGWDTAAAALFLASDDARYLNGVILPVDGGVDNAAIHIPGLVSAMNEKAKEG